MKKLLLLSGILFAAFFKAQTYSSLNISLIATISPHPGTGVGTDGRKYNGCFGWKQPNTNKEYAILGSSIGTYFIDVTTPSSPSVCAFVAGKTGCTWREIQTYQNYCYVVSDDAAPNTFQIIDMSALPATVTVVHNGNTYFERGHTIFIDGNKMYVGSVTYTAGNNPSFSSMDVYSLDTPTAPSFQARLSQSYPSITHVHDMHVRNDTVFASCGNQGLFMYRYNASLQSFTQLGSYTNYAGSPYNHSSAWTADRKHLVFCDEVPESLPIRLIDIQNFGNPQPVSNFNPHPATTPHNPYMIGNDYAVVACYQDGLNIYNVSNPSSPTLAGFFDTHPQGGFNTGDYDNAPYRGNWGAYPFLPSGIILASDMQNGLFILNASQALNTGLESHSAANTDLVMYPNPASSRIALFYNKYTSSNVQIRNVMGQLIYEKEFNLPVNEYISVKDFASGTYYVTLTENNKTVTKKLVVTH